MSEFVDLLRAWYEYLGGILSVELQDFWARFSADGAFRAGFLQACGLALFVGFISSRLLFWYGRVKAFYRQVAVVNLGPKPSEVQRSCTMAGLKIVVIVLVILCLVLAMLSSLIGSS